MRENRYFKEFIKYSSLNVLGMIGLSCYILADTFFVSKGLGSDGLAALNLAIPIYSIIHGSGLMLGIGGAAKYSIFKSCNKNNEANKIFTNTIFLAFIFSFMFVFTGILLSKAITSLLGANTDIFEMTNTYLKILLLFSPVFILNDIFICFVRNDGNPKLAMLGMIIGSLFNIIFDYLFIFPLNMGILGAVIATGFSPVVSMIILSRHLTKKKNSFHFINAKPDFIVIKSISLSGFPSLVTEISSGTVIITFNSIILALAENIGVAAYGIIANLSLVIISIYTGIAHGVQPLLSKTYGYNDKKGIKQLLLYSIITAISISCIVYFFILFFADYISSIFNSENNSLLQNISVTGLKLYFTAIFFAGFNIVFSTFFTSVEKNIPAHIISLTRGLILIIPMAFFLSSIWGLTGIWITFPVTEFIVSIIGISLYISLIKNK